MEFLGSYVALTCSAVAGFSAHFYVLTTHCMELSRVVCSTG